MTILGRGDLSPPRRHRRRGGWRILLVLLVLAGLAAAGWYAYGRWLGDDDTATVRTAPTPCVTPSAPPPPADPSGVTVRVLNGTPRVGLAHRLARQLHSRGFRVGKVGNAPHKARATTILYGSSHEAGAIALHEQLPDATMLARSTATLSLTIGPDFHGLADPAEVVAAHDRDVAAASPSPPACAGS